MSKNYMTLRVRCPFCNALTTVDNITNDEYRRILIGQERIQDVVPHLSAETRELIISGICPECQKSTFGEEEDE